MYAVVGCSECSALWIITTDPETTECPRCGTRHQVAKLKRFVETEDKAHAREIRGSMLANRQGEGDAFAAVDAYAELETQLDTAGVDDEMYLRASGVDPDAAAQAGQQATTGTGSAGRGSVAETIREGLETLDHPTKAELISYVTARGISETTLETGLEKLKQNGEIVRDANGYRLI